MTCQPEYCKHVKTLEYRLMRLERKHANCKCEKHGQPVEYTPVKVCRNCSKIIDENEIKGRDVDLHEYPKEGWDD